MNAPAFNEARPKRRLDMDQQSAARTAPAEITGCEEKSELYIRVTLAKAVQCTLKARYRLASVAARTSDSERQKLWNAGPEKTWFDAYDARKLARIQETFERIGEILSSPKLSIICDPNFALYAKALPGIRRIRLGRMWIDLDPEERSERIQTFIHEAAHIAGRSVGNETPWYGRTGAQTMASKMELRKRPMMVTRSAENHGYYAIDVAAAFSVLLWA
jgi:hypothetical protein